MTTAEAIRRIESWLEGEQKMNFTVRSAIRKLVKDAAALPAPDEPVTVSLCMAGDFDAGEVATWIGTLGIEQLAEVAFAVKDRTEVLRRQP